MADRSEDRYFFHVKIGNRLDWDEHGDPVGSDLEAVIHGRRIAGELAHDPEYADAVVVVEDSRGMTLAHIDARGRLLYAHPDFAARRMQ